MSPLYWVVLGIMLVVAEMLTTGFFIVFFGMSAFVVALLTRVLGIPFAWQWALFTVLSVVFLVTMRRLFKRVFTGDAKEGDDMDDDFVGKNATVVEAILPGQEGRVEFRGCTWAAEADAEIPVGTRVRIRSKENITLGVERV